MSTRSAAIETVVGSLAANMRVYRAKAELTQEAAAERAALSSIYWKQLEYGTAANPSLAIVVRVAAALGVEPAELLRYRVAPAPRPPGRPRAESALAANPKKRLSRDTRKRSR